MLHCLSLSRNLEPQRELGVVVMGKRQLEVTHQWHPNHAAHIRLSAEQGFIAPEALAALLSERSEACATGTMFLTTDTNHWGCFGHDDGVIVTFRCRAASGARAL